MVNIKPQPGIMKIDLYEGGASELKGQNDVLKLSSNENPFGPSPKAVKYQFFLKIILNFLVQLFVLF